MNKNTSSNHRLDDNNNNTANRQYLHLRCNALRLAPWLGTTSLGKDWTVRRHYV